MEPIEIAFLKQLADEMLNEFQLVERLRKFGEVRLHGAYEMDLMTWPEIDVWLLNSDVKSEMTWQMIGDLACVVPPTHVHVVNQLDHSLSMTPPDSITIDYRFIWRNVEWKLDICVGSYQRHIGGLAYLDQVKPQLMPEKREAILAIKQLATASPVYRKSRWKYVNGRSQFKSIDIYRAVLVDGVRTPREFADYLWRHARIEVSQDFGLQPGTFSIVASP